jgi:hypothetical protein
VKKNTKADIQNYPTYKGKLELIFKILDVLINLSLFEDLFSNEKNRNDCLKKYDDLFKKLDNEK